MKRWLILVWLLIPVALVSYHFGPEEALAFRTAQAHLADARELERGGHWEEAIEKFDQTLVALPEAADDKDDRTLARDQIRLAHIRARFELGYLAETIDSLKALAEEVEERHGAQSPLAYDVRDFLGRVHFQAMVALRLESAEEAVWKRHWELSRQNFRFLAEHTHGSRNRLDRQNLEAVIKSADLPTPSFAAPAGGAATTAGLAPPTKNPPTVAGGAGPPNTTDARPRQKAPGVPPPPTPDEFDLGS